MKQWLQKNVWWTGLVIPLAFAFFPHFFARVGNIVDEYLSAYWLQSSVVIIIVLLGMVLKRL